MKWTLVTEGETVVGLVPGTAEAKEEPGKPGQPARPAEAKELSVGRKQKAREVELPDDLAQVSDPEEFVKRLKKALPDVKI